MTAPTPPSGGDAGIDEILNLMAARVTLDVASHKVADIPNDVETAKAAIQAVVQAEVRKARLDEVYGFTVGKDEHIAFTYKLQRLAELEAGNGEAK